ncbi:MAG: hypothetical protein ACPHJE_03640 [Poseidonia sp.]
MGKFFLGIRFEFTMIDEVHPMNYIAGISEVSPEILTAMVRRWKDYDEDGRGALYLWNRPLPLFMKLVGTLTTRKTLRNLKKHTSSLVWNLMIPILTPRWVGFLLLSGGVILPPLFGVFHSNITSMNS